MSNANRKQEGGSHYASEYQHWDFVRECLDGRYLEGNLTKYIYRWRKKNGLQDIRKAIHYCTKIRELFNSDDLEAPTFARRSGSVDRFCIVNELGPLEARVMHICATWEGTGDLAVLDSLLRELESEALLSAMT